MRRQIGRACSLRHPILSDDRARASLHAADLRKILRRLPDHHPGCQDLFIRLAHINGHFTLEDFKEQMYNIKVRCCRSSSVVGSESFPAWGPEVQTLFRKLGINLDGINAEEL